MKCRAWRFVENVAGSVSRSFLHFEIEFGVLLQVRVGFVDTGSSETVSTMNCDEHVMAIFNIVIEFAEDERVADAFVQHEDIEYRRHGVRRC